MMQCCASHKPRGTTRLASRGVIIIDIGRCDVCLAALLPVLLLNAVRRQPAAEASLATHGSSECPSVVNLRQAPRETPCVQLDIGSTLEMTFQVSSPNEFLCSPQKFSVFKTLLTIKRKGRNVVFNDTKLR